ncbi:hypothetical protein GW17_00010772 [Ensete ventricosum]|nr:hypothetical protein GW17_00010772 [Ensete ventricosum]
MRYQIFYFVSSDTGLYQAIMVKTDCSRLRSVYNTDKYYAYRAKKRENKRENLEIWHYSHNPDSRQRASWRFGERIFGHRGEKKTTFLLPTHASCRGFAERFLLPAQAYWREDVSSTSVERRNISSPVCLGISLDTDVPYRSELDMPVQYKMADLDFDDRIILIME